MTLPPIVDDDVALPWQGHDDARYVNSAQYDAASRSLAWTSDVFTNEDLVRERPGLMCRAHVPATTHSILADLAKCLHDEFQVVGGG